MEKLGPAVSLWAAFGKQISRFNADGLYASERVAVFNKGAVGFLLNVTVKLAAGRVALKNLKPN